MPNGRSNGRETGSIARTGLGLEVRQELNVDHASMTVRTPVRQTHLHTGLATIVFRLIAILGEFLSVKAQKG